MGDWESRARAGTTVCVFRPTCIAMVFLVAACGSDDSESREFDASGATQGDAAAIVDAAAAVDANRPDALPSVTDASTAERTTLFPQFCPSSVTAPGLYEGTLASNLNDVSGCGALSAPGRDGAVRLELEPGASVSATLRHAGDGAVYILDSCPVVSSCLDSSDQSISGAETVSYTNDTGITNIVYVVLDSDDLAGPQTFELDLSVSQ